MHSILLITAGLGPLEARRFSAKLVERLTTVAQGSGLTVIDRLHQGPADAPWSTVLHLSGKADEVMASEVGTHALVHRDPGQATSRRKRWFVRVDLLSVPSFPPPSLGPIQVEVCRARGPGGQNVNRRNTAVRVTDPVSGISVRAEERRSQSQNRRKAIARLKSAILSRSSEDRATVLAAVRKRLIHVVRGGAVRTYQLDPRGRLEETHHVYLG